MNVNMVMMCVSTCIEGPDELNEVVLALVLNFLFLHAQVVVVAVVSVHDNLVQIANNANLRISLHIVLGPFLQLALLDENFGLVHYLHVETVVLVDRVDLAALGILDQLQHVIAVNDNSLLLLSGHVVAQNFSDDLSVQNLLEFIERVLVFCTVINEQSVEFLLMDWLDIVLGNFSIGSFNFFVLDLLEGLLEIGEVAGSGKEHKQIFVDILETAVYVGRKLPDQLGSHVIFHTEKGQELSEVVDVVKGTLLFQLLSHVLLAVLVRSRLIGRKSLGDF